MTLRRIAALARDWLYRDAHYLAVDLELDAERARRWIPRPLKLAKPARATLFTAFFPHTTFGSIYREAGVLVDVTHWGRRAVFCPWMVVDDDVALIAGRELLGYPKKLAEITWQHDGDRITAIASRRGHRLVAMTAQLGAPIAKPPPILGRPHRNVRGLAVVAFTPRERAIAVRTANVQLELGGSERDPLHELGHERSLGARLHRVDLGGALPPLPIAAISPITYARHLLARTL
jgi:acetoacetate decarboxylase